MRSKNLLFSTLLLFVASFSTTAWAQQNANTSLPNTMPTPSAPVIAIPSANQPSTQAQQVPPPPTINAKGYILVDANSGYILAQQNGDQRLAPASLTKLMTMYVASGALRSGQIHLDDKVTISESAWKTGGSRMFIQVGSQVPLQDLINGIVVASGNDACVAMAEHIAGSESTFVNVMNKTAAQLGMKNSHFTDATGLPDPNNYTTPFDLALLTRSIIRDYPEDYKFYSQKWIVYNGIKQPNRNRLLWRDPTVDGLKTGHTDDAGFCLAASANRNGMRLIAVIMGAPSDKARADDTQALLNYGYRFFETHKLYAANTALSKQRVWMGKNKEVGLGLARDMYVTIPAGQYNKLQGSLTITNSHLKAPVQKGQSYGNVTVTLNNQTIATQPLVALNDDPEGNIWDRTTDRVSMLFKKWFSFV